MSDLLSTGTNFAGLFGPDTILSSAGVPVPGTNVTVYETVDGSTEGSTATVYTDWTKGSTAANPVTTDGNGVLTFFADPGLYILAFLVGGVPTTKLVTVSPFYPDAAWNVVEDTANASPNSGDFRLCNASTGAFTETLVAPTIGARYKIAKTDSSANVVSITTPSGVFLGPGLGSGQATITLTGQGMCVEVIADGTDYHVTANAISRCGIIEMWGGTYSTVPPGSVYCNGQAISRTTFADLFAAIGTIWGDGDGSTTFNVPDFRSVSPIGVGTGSHTGTTTRSAGVFYGAEEHAIAADELPQHLHSITNVTHQHAFPSGQYVGTNTGSTLWLPTSGSAQVTFSAETEQYTGITATDDSAVPTTETPIVGPSLGVVFIIWTE